MKKIILSIFLFSSLSSQAIAGLGPSVGMGLPFLTQIGLNLTMGPSWSAYLGQGGISVDSGDVKLELSMPEVGVNWHPFAGSFYIGLGLGKEKLTAKATDDLSGESAEAEITANTTIAKLGWMWGKADGGFWFGMDLAYIMPSGGEVDVEVSNPAMIGTSEFKDVEEAGEEFGETAYMNITFARLGYLF